MKNIFRTLTLAALMGAGVLGARGGDYSVVCQFPADMEADGAMAFLVNFDSGEKIDSVTVADNTATFKGSAENAFLVRLIVDGQRAGQFIVEDGAVAYNVGTRETKGGKLNTAMDAYNAQVSEIAKAYKAAQTDAERGEIYAQYLAVSKKTMQENIDNVIGYSVFLDQAYEMEPDEVVALVDANPSLKKYKRVEKLLLANKNKAATQPGNKFADFEISYEGKTHRLSDVVGKGDYVLVDFWASWCGPCIRQTAVIKDLYNEYKDKGLKVLGVAVWDEPDDTLKAIKQHDLPWEAWLNGGNIPTDVYGISGIPCIILFGPDGTILSRDKQDDALRDDVKAALEK